MPNQRINLLSGLQIPQPDFVIHAATCQKPTIPTDGDRFDHACYPRQGFK